MSSFTLKRKTKAERLAEMLEDASPAATGGSVAEAKAEASPSAITSPLPPLPLKPKRAPRTAASRTTTVPLDREGIPVVEKTAEVQGMRLTPGCEYVVNLLLSNRIKPDDAMEFIQRRGLRMSGDDTQSVLRAHAATVAARNAPQYTVGSSRPAPINGRMA